MATASEEVFFFFQIPIYNKAIPEQEALKKGVETVMPGRKKLVLESAWCKGCGVCAAFCPRQVLEVKNGKACIKDAGQCVACGMCELRCPDYAIYLVNEEE